MTSKNYANKLWKKAIGGALISVLLAAVTGCNSSDDAAGEGAGDVTVESTAQASSPAATTVQEADEDRPPSAWLIYAQDENGEYAPHIQGHDIPLDVSLSTVSDPENATFVVTTSDGQVMEPDADGGVVLNFPEPGVYTATLTVTDSQGRSDESLLTLGVVDKSHYQDSGSVIR